MAFYAFDVLGNTSQITTESAALTATYDYDAFGRTIIADETMTNAFRFVGRFGVVEDSASMHFMRARRYDSIRGRFATADPIGFGGRDENLYRYAFNNPERFMDPSGLHIWTIAVGSRYELVVGVNSQSGQVFLGGGVQAGKPGSWCIGGTSKGDIIGQVGVLAYSSEAPKIGAYFSAWIGRGLIGGISGRVGDDPSIGGMLGVGAAIIGGRPLVEDTAVLGGRGSGAAFDAYFVFPTPLFIPKDLLPWLEHGVLGVAIVRPRDPNDKIGPTGVGPDRLVSAQDEMDYMIRFENHPTATAPVQELVVVDYLDPNLDWSTVEFGEIRYGDRVITVPAGQLNFSARDLPPTNSIAIIGITLGQMAVDTTATFNSQNGRLEWRLLAKDTANNQFPYDALAGFLPPNNTNTHCGEGHLTFRVKPKLGLEIGTRIENKASIVFDLNDPIETPPVTNTIGQVAPKLGASIAYAASEMSLGTPFTLSLTVSNSGMTTATNVVVSNAIPAGFTFVNATGTVGTVTYTNGNVIWTIGALSNGVPATLTVTLLPTQGGYFVSPIHIGGGNGLVLDLNPLFSVQPPLIGVEAATNGMIEIFAPSVATSYVFEASQDLLGSPPGWQSMTNVPTITGDRQVISINSTNGAFFRLRKH
jgi:RHS repeat-associated protein/uncharacterized repeat protein (TIGR01451 family)